MTVNAILSIISFNTSTPAIYVSEDVQDLADPEPACKGHLSLLGKGTMQRTSRTNLKPLDIFFASDFELKHHCREMGVGGQGQ